MRRWREWEADAETVIELCGEEEEEGDEDAAAMLDEAMEVRYRCLRFLCIDIDIVRRQYGGKNDLDFLFCAGYSG